MPATVVQCSCAASYALHRQIHLSLLRSLLKILFIRIPEELAVFGQNSRAYWQNSRMTEGVLPDSNELAEPPAQRA